MIYTTVAMSLPCSDLEVDLGIRVLCAAAVIALSVGQAEAATYAEGATYNINITLHEAKEEIWSADLSEIVTVNPYGEYWAIPVGETRRGRLTIKAISDFEDRAIITIGGVAIFDGYGDMDPGNIHASQMHGMPWDMTFLRWQNGAGTLEYAYDGTWITRGAHASLALAAVPLPATAVLLPVGIGALAMMRKRRRAVS